MAKLMTFVMTSIVIMFLLYVSGTATTAGYVLSVLGVLDSPENFKTAALYVAVLAALTTLGAASALKVAGSGVNAPDFLAATALAIVLGAFIGDFITVLTTVSTACPIGSNCRWTVYLASGIMIPIIVGYALSLFDWARGND